MGFEDYKLSSDVSKDPIIMDGFEIQLKGYVNDEGEQKRFCTLTLNSSEGDFKFILLPEEMKKLADVGLDTIKGIELREDMMPKIVSANKLSR